MTESLAAFRTRKSADLRGLAEQHLQHEYVYLHLSIDFHIEAANL